MGQLGYPDQALKRGEEAVANCSGGTASSAQSRLRATTGLPGLLRDTNRRDEARTMLAAIDGWFSEGFDTADLKDAKALLDELN